jgi:hypothetical protein
MAAPDSESPSTVTLPSAEPSDSEEVTRALKLAHMLWEEGQQREAVRTLQRGAAAAEEVGNDLRALTLARCAADLSAQLGASGSTPPAGGSVPPAPAFPAPGTPAPPEVAAALPNPNSSPSSAASPPSTTPNPPGVGGAAPITVPNPPGVGGPAPVTVRSLRPASAASGAIARKSETPSSPGALAADATPPPSSDLEVPVVIAESEAEAPVSATPASAPPISTPLASTTIASPTTTPSPVRAMGRVATSPSVVPERQQPSKTPAARPTNGVTGLAFPITARELRVAVKRSALDETLFVVRPLAPGARAPAGSREATLVFSDVDPE